MVKKINKIARLSSILILAAKTREENKKKTINEGKLGERKK